MQLNQDGHASDECLEQYTLGSLEEPLLGELEEHLLLCSQCQDHLREIDAYHAAMRNAAAQLEREDEARKRLRTRISALLTVRRLGWLLALGAVIVAGMSLRLWINRQAPPSVALILETSRGAEVRHAPARRPLDLSLDTTALPEYPVYLLETVDALGKVQAQFQVSAAEGSCASGCAGLNRL